MSQADNTPLYTHYAGPALLETPLLNKGSAFSREERAEGESSTRWQDRTAQQEQPAVAHTRG